MKKPQELNMISDIWRAVQNGHTSLNEWEESFLTSLQEQLKKRRKLSKKQDEKLYDLWLEAVS